MPNFSFRTVSPARQRSVVMGDINRVLCPRRPRLFGPTVARVHSLHLFAPFSCFYYFFRRFSLFHHGFSCEKWPEYNRVALYRFDRSAAFAAFADRRAPDRLPGHTDTRALGFLFRSVGKCVYPEMFFGKQF